MGHSPATVVAFFSTPAVAIVWALLFFEVLFPGLVNGGTSGFKLDGEGTFSSLDPFFSLCKER